MKKRSGKEMLCWTCNNTDETRCSWFGESMILPKGTKVDEKGYIIECPNYTISREVATKRGQIAKLLAELSKKYNVSIRTVARYRSRYKDRAVEKLENKYGVRNKI